MADDDTSDDTDTAENDDTLKRAHRSNQSRIDNKLLAQQLDKENENWMKSYWRPAMGWLYMIICLSDFVIFPIFSMFLPVFIKMSYVPWKSLTLDNGGMIHLAFGAILGITSYTRGQQKLASYRQ